MAQSGIVLQSYGSHAEFEQECGLCHQPLATDQTDLCTRCHENVAEQRSAQSGTHGRIDAAMPCRTCHPEHQGRDYDPVAFAVTHFDHNLTDLPLTGAHASLDCESCHAGGDYQLAYQGCSGCHAEPALHAGVFEGDCAECHTDLEWQPAMIAGRIFDHEETTFSLVRHTGLPAEPDVLCADCHMLKTGKASAQACAACHTLRDASFMDEHTRVLGNACLECHDGKDRMVGFDHASVFPLDGKHQALDCAGCHANFQFAGTPSQCGACHAEPEVHAGYFGTDCQRCHGTSAWTPAKLTGHTFPLDHGEEGELACQTCHPASYPQYTCYECHEHQPEAIAQEHIEEGISTEELAQCAECHPTGREEEHENDEN